MLTHPALIENVLKDIPKLPPSRISSVSAEFGISKVSDFSPEGDRISKSVSWSNISLAVLARDDYSCRICGKSSLSQVDNATVFRKIHFELEVHHIIPRKDGGSDSFANLITLCEECHKKTFSRGYSGIPAGKEIDLFSFEKNILFAVPPDYSTSLNRGCRIAVLRDYERVFDQEENRYRVVSVTNSKMKVTVIPVTMEEYREIVSMLVIEHDVKDYITVWAYMNGKESQIRVLCDSRSDLLV